MQKYVEKCSFGAELGLGGSVWVKAMETLPGPKTAVKKSKIQKRPKMMGNPKIQIFLYIPINSR